MELFDHLGDLNWLAVVIAALSNFLVGFVWYDRRVFGARWGELVGLSEEDMGSGAGMGVRFALLGLVALLTAIVLGLVMGGLGIDSLAGGLVVGAVLGLVVRAGAHQIHNGFARRPGALTLIDGAHDTVAMALMGAIIGAFA
jgi:hypothetical protein